MAPCITLCSSSLPLCLFFFNVPPPPSAPRLHYYITFHLLRGNGHASHQRAESGLHSGIQMCRLRDLWDDGALNTLTGRAPVSSNEPRREHGTEMFTTRHLKSYCEPPAVPVNNKRTKTKHFGLCISEHACAFCLWTWLLSLLAALCLPVYLLPPLLHP